MLSLNMVLSPSSPPRDLRLYAFVLASLALHGLLLWGGRPKADEPELPLGETLLQVQLQTAEHSRPRAETALTKLLTTAVDPSARVAVKEARDRDRTASATESAIAPTATSADSSALQNYLLGLLQSELSRTLRYPPLARERGWQGTVLLGVAVAPDGALRGMRLLRSSGYALLDAVSLDSLRRIHTLPLAAGWRHSGSIEVILPIRFQLAENS
jgi:TonB family protein